MQRTPLGVVSVDRGLIKDDSSKTLQHLDYLVYYMVNDLTIPRVKGAGLRL